MPRNLRASFHDGAGDRFVIEGDEYNAAYFDRGPKFLHYRPETLILTGVEHDHIDLYPDVGSFRQAFRDLISILPADGLIAADGDTPEVRRLLEAAPCEVVTYGFSDHVDVRPLQPPTVDADGTRFTLDDGGKRVELRLRVPGDHNVRNALGVWIAARRDGLGADEVAAALASFRGVQRRLEVIRDAPGPLVFDDFAHHPTEIAASLSALRRRYPDRRLIACFEPRSLTAGRAHLFESYLEAFAPADLVLLAPVFHADRLQDEERIDLEELASTLSRRGVDARATDGESRILEIAVAETRPDDVLVTMSSGSFGGLPRRIAAALPAHAAGQEISGPPESGL
jgi:UDP-N-acetylmuramate: L-alanyl-gamma-D-glutamyl-meso-diaminopimelate ligase